MDAGHRHPTARTWSFPPNDRPPLEAGLERANLRELAARPERFEHHLLVIARVANAQLELVAASEPLAFAHRNISDEYALALSTGDPAIDGFPFLTLLSDYQSGADVGRLRHRVGQLVLHPEGLVHWPGRLRPPFQPMAFPPGMRRSGLSLVFCASEPVPAGARPLFVSEGLEGEAKSYRPEPVPFLLADLTRESERTVARVGQARMDLVTSPTRLAPARGGYVIVLEARAPHAPTDIVFVPEGAELAGDGIDRALVVTSEEHASSPPPPSWRALPEPPFAPFETAPRARLPFEGNGLHVAESNADTVRIAIGASEAEVPRYWLARMLFRLALHDYRLGYLETYGGFYYDDRGGRFRLGLRDGASIELTRDELASTIERVYRAVPPEGYVERL